VSFLCHLQGNGNKILRLLFRCGGVDVQTIKQYEKKTVSMALTAAEFKYQLSSFMTLFIAPVSIRPVV
jgi:translation elongation factor EF-1alpha